jgi:hypothetical protein
MIAPGPKGRVGSATFFPEHQLADIEAETQAAEIEAETQAETEAETGGDRGSCRDRGGGKLRQTDRDTRVNSFVLIASQPLDRYNTPPVPPVSYVAGIFISGASRLLMM